jgi:hypothetical protein
VSKASARSASFSAAAALAAGVAVSAHQPAAAARDPAITTDKTQLIENRIFMLITPQGPAAYCGPPGV